MDFEKIYETIAKKHGVSVQEVKTEMELALQMAWESGKTNSEAEGKQKKISPNGEVPTAEDFIRFMTDKIIMDQSET